MEKKTLEEMGTEMTGLTVKNTIVKETEEVIYGIADYTSSNYPIIPGQSNYTSIPSSYGYTGGVISVTGVNTSNRLLGVIVNLFIYPNSDQLNFTVYNAGPNTVNMGNMKFSYILFK